MQSQVLSTPKSINGRKLYTHWGDTEFEYSTPLRFKVRLTPDSLGQSSRGYSDKKIPMLPGFLIIKTQKSYPSLF